MSCKICQRDVELTFHHLIPRTLHTNQWFKKRYTKQYMAKHGIDVCRLCHDKVHSIWDEKTLGREVNTLELILESEEIQNFIPWVQKQK